MPGVGLAVSVIAGSVSCGSIVYVGGSAARALDAQLSTATAANAVIVIRGQVIVVPFPRRG